MKTRCKSYDDYGFEPGEEKQLKEACRKKDFKTLTMLTVASYKSNPGIAIELIYSLVNGLSYDKLESINYIPVSKVDFYAYRRKCLYYFKLMSEKQKRE